MADTIKILGHRGVKNQPDLIENTTPAFAHALATADGLETDVVCSADGVPYLLHDTSIRIIPHVVSWVTETWKKNVHPESYKIINGRDFRHMHSSEVDEIFLADGCTIPRLSELFILSARFQDKKILNLELKAPWSADPVIKAIDEAERKGWIDRSQVILSSFDHHEMVYAQRIDPSIRTGLIFWQDSMRPCRLYPWSEKNLANALPVSIENLGKEYIRQILPDYFILPAQGLTKIYSDAVKMEYSKSSYIVWTPGWEPLPEKNRALHEKLRDSAIGPRIAAVITNYPEEMARLLRP